MYIAGLWTTYLGDHTVHFSGHTVRPASNSLNANVMGSVLGPVAFIINASNLKCMTPGNVAVKYTDDNYLIVPSKTADLFLLSLRMFHPGRKPTILS